VQHGRIACGGRFAIGRAPLAVLVALNLPRPQVQLDAAGEGRVRVGFEGGVDEIRQLSRPPVDFDDVRPLDLAEVGAAAAFVNPQDRRQRIQGALVDVQVVRQQFADGRALAGQIDGGRVAGLEQVRVRLGTRPCIGAEERLHVALQRESQLRQRQPFAEAGQGQVNHHVLAPPFGRSLPSSPRP